MTENDERRALFWIRRWKMIGGGFDVHLAEEGGARQLTVEIVRTRAPGERITAKDKAADAMEQELVKDRKKHLHIGELVRDAWVRANPGEATVEMAVTVPVPANDAEAPEPAA